MRGEPKRPVGNKSDTLLMLMLMLMLGQLGKSRSVQNCQRHYLAKT